MLRSLDDHIAIIKAAANNFWNLSEFDPAIYSKEDLISEGVVCFLELNKKYPSLSAAEFRGYLKVTLRDRFYNSYKRSTSFVSDGERQSKFATESYEAYLEDNNAFEKPVPDAFIIDNTLAIDSYLSLSNEAREVADLLMNAPTELVQLGGEFMVGLRQHLHKVCKWKHAKITAFFTKLHTQESACST